MTILDRCAHHLYTPGCAGCAALRPDLAAASVQCERHIADAVAVERAAIVAFIRNNSDANTVCGEWFADAIERGEHLRTPDKSGL